jgi:hypothetical protein
MRDAQTARPEGKEVSMLWLQLREFVVFIAGVSFGAFGGKEV